ncbi:class I SAM-dependent methyltransferase [Cognatiluteimonas profundi]|uniref:class I SAM-dependent methyltransferase n=1 Tax=Cognatiluteimonas profundi TaxID=2594501 RepID=UPI00131BA7EB|nr:class I SAM-dependent methyltransferase [Lysobacter profundi]
MDSTPAFDGVVATRIARAFLPQRWYGNRWHYHYSRIKLGSDPLYPGVASALRGSERPLLDLGCGIGLLAHALRAEGLALAYRGVDNDAGKIDEARRAASTAALDGVVFEVVDLARTFPVHAGSVAILDVLQYLDDAAQRRLLDAAIAMLVPGSRLVIRTGIEDGSRRMWLTRTFDRIANLLGWMNAAPHHYPRADDLRATLANAGLQVAFTPLRGNTPFNNWMVVAQAP